MNNSNKRKVNVKTLWVAVLASYAFVILQIVSHFFKFEYNDFLDGFGIGIIIGAIVLIIQDMVQSKIYNKPFWILSMLFMPIIAAIIYMIQRDKLIRLGKGFNLNRDSPTKK